MSNPKYVKYLEPQVPQTNIRRNSYFWLELICQHCGEPFQSKRVHKLYCSGRCRVAAHRARREIE